MSYREYNGLVIESSAQKIPVTQTPDAGIIETRMVIGNGDQRNVRRPFVESLQDNVPVVYPRCVQPL